MNELDYLIIYELQKNPRKRNTELAKQFGVSEASIRRHIANLVSSGTLMMTAIPNTSHLGYGIRAFIGLQVEVSRIKTVAERLVLFPELHYVGLCSGTTDILALGLFPSNGKLSKFIRTVLGEIPGILRIDTVVELDNLKFTFGRLQSGILTPFGRLAEENGSARLSNNYGTSERLKKAKQKTGKNTRRQRSHH